MCNPNFPDVLLMTFLYFWNKIKRKVPQRWFNRCRKQCTLLMAPGRGSEGDWSPRGPARSTGCLQGPPSSKHDVAEKQITFNCDCICRGGPPKIFLGTTRCIFFRVSCLKDVAVKSLGDAAGARTCCKTCVAGEGSHVTHVTGMTVYKEVVAIDGMNTFPLVWISGCTGK